MTTTLLACTDKGADGEETGVEETDEPSVEICDNAADDDEDGDIDCDDADCADDAACVVVEDEVCTDAIDNDDDGDIDCDDADCADDASCAEPTSELDCDNAADDDADGAIDCDDSDCAGDVACESVDVEVACVDGLDNDADGLADCDDTDCAADPSCAAPDVEIACVDEADNDGDGLIDCADPDCMADPDCTTVEVEVACVDGVDNDADGLTDCDDSDCAASPDCLVEVVELICGDTVDNDGDGAVDCDDSDCTASADCVVEVVELMCDDGLDDDLDGAIDCDDADCAADAACAVSATCAETDLGSALGAAVATGSNVGAGDDYAASCISSGGEDVSFLWTAPEDGSYTISTEGSTFDTGLTLWSDDCGAERTCDDDDGDGTTSIEVITAVAGEQIVIVVEGYSSSSSGDYALNIYPAYESSCRDGLDDDDDGGIDCADAECSGDATCIPEPVCVDGLDDDLDGATDCADSDCADLLVCTNPCADDELGSPVGAGIASGSTVGGGDDYTSECAFYSAEDVAWLWTAPADGVYSFDTVGSSYDTILAVELGDCSATELDCNDDTYGTLSEVSVALLAGEEVVIQVDGYDGAGDYTLNVWSDTEVDCTDGGDEDLDGATDCADVDCTGSITCIPESVCDDATDDDADGNQDCLDSDCSADAVCDPSLADYDLGSATGTAVATGTTVGAGNDLTPSCGYSSAEDVAYSWVAPYAGSWTFDLSGSVGMTDTVLGLYAADGSSLGCDDDSGTGYLSLEVVTLDAGQLVIIGVDGYSSYSGGYSLAIY